MPRKGRNIYKRKDDRWEARVCYPGSKKYKSVYGKTFKEAIAKQDKLRAEMKFPDKADHLISTLAECWLEDKKHTVKKSTFYAYLTKINKHILPYFSETRFSVLNEQVLSGFVAAKRGENLSEKYICDMVIPSLNEQKKLRNHLLNCDDSISLGIILGMFTGLRIGELCAVRWSDICEENDAITISKSMQRLPVMQDSNKISKNKTQVIITTPKTNTSARTKKPIPSLF